MSSPNFEKRAAQERLSKLIIRYDRLQSNGDPRVEEIIIATCLVFNVTKEKLLSRSRYQRIADARQVAMFLLRTNLNLSFREIGEAFGRDHTTAYHAFHAVPDKSYEVRFQESVSAVNNLLRTVG